MCRGISIPIISLILPSSSYPLLSLTFSFMSTRPTFAPERGRLALAETLWSTYGTVIHCPKCPIEPGRSGHIKDSAGKKTKALESRRAWTCRVSKASCRRWPCSEYIDEARVQLGHFEGDTRFSVLLNSITPGLPPTHKSELEREYLPTVLRPKKPSHYTPRPQPDPVTPFIGGNLTLPLSSSPCLKRKASSDPIDEPTLRKHHTRTITDRQTGRLFSLSDAVRAADLSFDLVWEVVESHRQTLNSLKSLIVSPVNTIQIVDTEDDRNDEDEEDFAPPTRSKGLNIFIDRPIKS